MKASTTLRQEFPALALVTGFANPKMREQLADLLLLWLEINRARNAAESMIAAARITWWREALDEGKPESVPLAERLIATYPDITPITAMLQQVVNITLNGGDDHQICHVMGDLWAKIFNNGQGGDDCAHILLAFRSAMSGNALDSDLAASLMAKPIPQPIKLIAWLAQDPKRLSYPEAQPLLPFKMMLRAIRL